MPDDVLDVLETDPLETDAISADAGAEPEGAQPVEGEEQPTGPIERLFDGKAVAAPIKNILVKIKAEAPEVAKALTKAVFRVGELEKEFPAGLGDAIELRDKIEEWGGLEKLEGHITGDQQFTELAQQYEKADPAFIEDLYASSPEAFATVAPMMFDKLKATNEPAFKAYIGREVHARLVEAQIPLLMARLADVLGDPAKAQPYFDALNVYLGTFQEEAKKAPDRAQPTPSQRPGDDTQSREIALRSREWQLDDKQTIEPILAAARAKALAGKKPDAQDRAAISEYYKIQFKILRDRLYPDFDKKCQRYIANNDKTGFLRYRQSVHQKIVPDALITAVNKAMRAARPANGVTRTTPPAQPAASRPRPETPATAAAGFTAASKEPGTHEIDYGRTSPAMLRANRAVLSDGRKVQWK